MVLPTGTGKTHLANLAIEKAERPTLIITPTIDLMDQWYDELTLTFAADVGLLGGGYYEVKPLTVTTYDSAHMHMGRIGNKFGLIVFDECHHLPGATYSQAAVCSLAPFRLGLTATPERADFAHEQLDGLIGPIVYRREIGQLKGDFLAHYRVQTLHVDLSEEERFRYERARELYKMFVFNNGIDMLASLKGWTRVPVRGASIFRRTSGLSLLSGATRAGTGSLPRSWRGYPASSIVITRIVVLIFHP